MQKLPNPAPYGGRRSRAQIRYIVLHGAAEGSIPPGTSVHYLVDGHARHVFSSVLPEYK